MVGGKAAALAVLGWRMIAGNQDRGAHRSESPMFSVLIPSRNRLSLLRCAVDSVLRQRADIEIVIADNASDENYASFLEDVGDVAYASRRSQIPLTVTENWNQALDAASGEYVIMLGDDDALAPGALARAAELIRAFDRPDALYWMAYHYAYPGVIPSSPQGYFATVNNTPLFRDGAEPYVLEKAEATWVATRALSFRHWFSFNSQHFVWKQSYIRSLKLQPFFQSPYPDYYSAMVTMLTADRIVIESRPHAIIGISPKSFGYFMHNAATQAGHGMLGLSESDANPVRGISMALDEALAFPGGAHLRNWLIAALFVARNFGMTDSVDVRRYRRIQIINSLSAKSEAADLRDQLRSQRLSGTERRLIEKVDWLLRMTDRVAGLPPTLFRDLLQNHMAIYAPPKVTIHDIGAHKSIVDVLSWLERGRSTSN